MVTVGGIVDHVHSQSTLLHPAITNCSAESLTNIER